jgi:hypothetical protein
MINRNPPTPLRRDTFDPRSTGPRTPTPNRPTLSDRRSTGAR